MKASKRITFDGSFLSESLKSAPRSMGYRTLLSGADTPIDVQQRLLRHAQISTTQKYGGPPMENQRRAHSKVVKNLLSHRSAG
jgi:integrase